MIQSPFSFAPATAWDLSAWYTKEPLCDRIVDWAHVTQGMTVLEPSCGDGRLARRLAARGARVTAYDIEPRYDEAIRCDFLGVRDVHFDLAVMNPPYEDGVDLEHAAAAARLCDRLVMVARLVFLAGQERHARFWSRYRLSRLAILSGRPSFDGPVEGTARHDFCVFEIGGPGPLTIEWWQE
jgi:predicted RNA methylase